MGKSGGSSAPIVIPQQDSSMLEAMLPMMQAMMTSMQNQQAPVAPQPVPQPEYTTAEDVMAQVEPKDWRTIADEIAQEQAAEFDAQQEDTYKPPETSTLLEYEEPETTESLLG